MNTPPLKETDYLKAWGLFYICAGFGGGFAGAIAGGLLGGILGAFGTSPATIRLACSIAGFFAALPVSYLLFRFIVSRFIVQKLTTLRVTNEPSNIA